MKVPLLDLQAQFASIKDEIVPAVMGLVESQRFILGPTVEALEGRVASLAGAAFGIGCASGTDALLLALKTLDLRGGGEVITTPFTFFATAGAIHNAGGRPVFVDIDPATFNLDVAAVEAAVTPRTRAIVAVHLYGQMAPMEQLLPLADAAGASVVEDAAQALGARRRVDGVWRRAGELGYVGAFSFFPSKNLGGWGDGGMMVTRHEAVAARLRRLRAHGGAKQYHHDEVGFNSRLDALQAAVLLAKLPHLPAWNQARRAHAEAYTHALAGLDGVCAPPTDAANEHTFHQYTIRADRRDALRDHLRHNDIGCAVYYPRALHEQPCFAELGYRRGQFPQAERACDEVLSLPVYPELTTAQRGRVIDAIREFYT